MRVRKVGERGSFLFGGGVAVLFVSVLFWQV